ncbi:MAG TPA: putative sulfate/molybdate transporter [Dermatophilaceae bacterium]|nr:putative sulfate/molybdate transporter [Dermatophilaceae bacterium]
MTAVPGHQTLLRFDRAELAGAFADLGVFVPIAVGLVVQNGLSATAVLVPAGLLYVVVGLVFRLPVPVQPLKAFGAIALAQGLGPPVVAAGALLMGALFLLLGATGLVDRAARLFPRALVRGIQLSVGLIFGRLALDLVTRPPASFADRGLSTTTLAIATIATTVLLVVLRRRSGTLLLVAIAAAVMVARHEGPWQLGPAPITLGLPDGAAFASAAVALVLPQLPLTFANSCVATADVARRYFGAAGARVTPGRLSMSLGAANTVVGLLAGMPVCHGAGGMTAHRSFGARTGGAPVVIGSLLVALGLLGGASVAALFAAFPLPALAALLLVAGWLHVLLLRDLRGWPEWSVAVVVGLVGLLVNLAVALAVGALLWLVVRRWQPSGGIALGTEGSRIPPPR